MASSAVYSVSTPVCYDLSDRSRHSQQNGHSGNVFRVLCPKTSTGGGKKAPTGWHDWHVFATLSKSSVTQLTLRCVWSEEFALGLCISCIGGHIMREKKTKS